MLARKTERGAWSIEANSARRSMQASAHTAATPELEPESESELDPNGDREVRARKTEERKCVDTITSTGPWRAARGAERTFESVETREARDMSRPSCEGEEWKVRVRYHVWRDRGTMPLPRESSAKRRTREMRSARWMEGAWGRVVVGGVEEEICDDDDDGDGDGALTEPDAVLTGDVPLVSE